jgi:hypothetical protein
LAAGVLARKSGLVLVAIDNGTNGPETRHRSLLAVRRRLSRQPAFHPIRTCIARTRAGHVGDTARVLASQPEAAAIRVRGYVDARDRRLCCGAGMVNRELGLHFALRSDDGVEVGILGGAGTALTVGQFPESTSTPFRAWYRGVILREI